MKVRELITGACTGLIISVLLCCAVYFYGIYLPAQISAANDYEVIKGILMGVTLTFTGFIISVLIVGKSE